MLAKKKVQNVPRIQTRQWIQVTAHFGSIILLAKSTLEDLLPPGGEMTYGFSAFTLDIHRNLFSRLLTYITFIKISVGVCPGCFSEGVPVRWRAAYFGRWCINSFQFRRQHGWLVCRRIWRSGFIPRSLWTSFITMLKLKCTNENRQKLVCGFY